VVYFFFAVLQLEVQFRTIGQLRMAGIVFEPVPGLQIQYFCNAFWCGRIRTSYDFVVSREVLQIQDWTHGLQRFTRCASYRVAAPHVGAGSQARNEWLSAVANKLGKPAMRVCLNAEVASYPRQPDTPADGRMPAFCRHYEALTATYALPAAADLVRLI
jgi:hypothetical protein